MDAPNTVGGESMSHSYTTSAMGKTITLNALRPTSRLSSKEFKRLESDSKPLTAVSGNSKSQLQIQNEFFVSISILCAERAPTARTHERALLFTQTHMSIRWRCPV